MDRETCLSKAAEVAFYASSHASRYKDYETWLGQCAPEVVHEFVKAAKCAASYAIKVYALEKNDAPIPDNGTTSYRTRAG